MKNLGVGHRKRGGVTGPGGMGGSRGVEQADTIGREAETGRVSGES